MVPQYYMVCPCENSLQQYGQLYAFCLVKLDNREKVGDIVILGSKSSVS